MRTWTLLAALALITSACSDETGTTTMSLGFSGLPQLGEGYEYESWLIVDGAPVSAGRFTVDADANPIPAAFEIDAMVADTAAAYVLTIEPIEGDDPAPSAVHILAGDLADGVASLSTAHAAAIGTDFADATGVYILETPTSGDVADDYAQGIWWLVPGADGMAPGLSLPALPEGWVYEGWVAGADGPVSTGTFGAVDAADADGAGETAGPDGSPPFPGQDFIDPAIVLTGGYAAVISVEPVPDDSPMPFVIKPLVDMTIDDVMAPDTQEMANAAASNLPSGSVTFAN
ncbi:MAG: anti-sigma factor [Sandaracinaceae bacterium]